jgi:hypothetical protein
VRVTKEKLEELCVGFREYKRVLGKQVLEVSSTPMAPNASAAGVAAAVAAAAASAAAATASAAAAGGGGGGGGAAAAGRKGAGAKSSGGGTGPPPPAASAAGGGGGKSGGKETKGVAGGGGLDIAPWTPPGPVFGAELNEQWRALLAQVWYQELIVVPTWTTLHVGDTILHFQPHAPQTQANLRVVFPHHTPSICEGIPMKASIPQGTCRKLLLYIHR